MLATMFFYGVLLWHCGTIRFVSSVSFCILFLTSQKKYARGATVTVLLLKTAVPVNSDKRADVYPQGVGRIRSAPSSLTAALAIGPYKLLCRITRGATAAVLPRKRQFR